LAQTLARAAQEAQGEEALHLHAATSAAPRLLVPLEPEVLRLQTLAQVAAVAGL
jgi:hypothetical protein